MGATRKTCRPCSVVGCHDDVDKRGWCGPHYQRWRKYGDPEGGGPRRGDHAARWWSKVQQSQACWLWLDAPTDAGYGHFWNGKREVPAHVFGYEMIVGPIPKGYELDHACRNRMCVKPTHLEAVTHSGNIRRSNEHCRRGHPLTPGNVYIYPKSKARLCVTCNPKHRATPLDSPLIAEAFAHRPSM